MESVTIKKARTEKKREKEYGTYQNFIDTAFTKEEKTMIPGTKLPDDKNPDTYVTSLGTPEEGEGSEGDRIFLLSVNEAIDEKYGLKTSLKPSSSYIYNKTNNHIALNTDYVQNGCGKTGYSADGSEGAGRWWLRSPGSDE